MEAARFAVGPSQCGTQQGDFAGKAEVTLNVFVDSSALAKRYIEERKEVIWFKPSSLLLQR